jgi:CHAT domain-containing protein
MSDLTAAPESVLPAEVMLGAAIANQRAGNYAMARSFYSKAISSRRGMFMQMPSPHRWPDQREVYVRVGDCCYAMDDFEGAILYYQRAIDIDASAEGGKTAAQSSFAGPSYARHQWDLLRKVGEMELAMGRCETALKHLRDAVRCEMRHSPNGAFSAAALPDLFAAFGRTYMEMGHYDSALSCFRHAATPRAAQVLNMTEMQYARTVERDRWQARIYRAWGEYSQALHSLELAYQAAQVHVKNNSALLSSIRCEMGHTLLAADRPTRALDSFEQAIQLAQSGKKTSKTRRGQGLTNGPGGDAGVGLAHKVSLLEGTAEALIRLGRHREAHEKLTAGIKGLQGMGKAKRQYALPLVLALGRLASRDGRPREAFTILSPGLEAAESQGKRPLQAEFHSSIGECCRAAGRTAEAAKHYAAAIDIIEELRKTAAGSARRDYLASQIKVYQALAETRLDDGNVEAALETVELATGKYLIEQMGMASATYLPAKMTSVDMSDWLCDEEAGLSQSKRAERRKGIMDNGPDAVRKLMAQLPPGTAMLRYANTTCDRMIVFVIRSTGVSAVTVRTGSHTNAATRAGPIASSPAEADTRGLRRIDKPQKAVANATSLDGAIRLNRATLAKPTDPSQRQGGAEPNEPGRVLYRYLIAPIEGKLAGISSLCIVPDGALALVPFEALVLPDGRYLLEKYDVRYVQSLRVAQYLRERTYKQPRKSLLAFGGAAYQEDDWRTGEAAATGEEGTRGIAPGMGPADKPPRTRGHGNWENLPGTLREVEALGALYQDARVVTGTRVSEALVKELEESGELKNYRMLHFATHGMTSPRSSILSALILSQTKDAKRGKDDGYLCMAEVAKLHLAADVVTLSACETGLGKIYSGEGVVGLGQAFLIAGANGLTLSLWQVADESTKRLMVDVYRLAQTEDIPFAVALARVKRQFIDDPDYSHPFFWAPFVYYGQ